MPTRILEGVLEPEDVDMCKRVFDHACRDLGLDPSSIDNQILAARILALFRSGVREERSLLAAVVRQRP
ncbi:hypothetical protein MesoLj113c_26600 [Mesorhizobium sp. 113-3-9]|nr:hypothetical protein MesoLj113c_26600 [Mesorhizobium sp. 113-3-9]